MSQDFPSPDDLSNRAAARKNPAIPSKPTRQLNTLLIIGLGVCLAVCITTLLIVVSHKKVPDPSAEQRMWDAQHHDEIIALKSAAEALAIEGKLPEAHAKYRAMEKIIGGRMVKDPALMDMVEQARGDQDRIFAIILKSMEPEPLGQPQMQAPVESVPPAPTALPPAPTPPEVSSPSTQAIVPTTQPVAPPATSVAPEVAPQPVTASVEAPEPPIDAIPTGMVPSITPITDAEVGGAIQRAVDYLVENMKGDEIATADLNDANRTGVNALCLYALLQTSKSTNDPRISIKGEPMKRAIAKLKMAKLDTLQIDQPLTYARSFRAAALAVYDRAEDRKALEADVNWLINASTNGSYTYDDRYAPNPAMKTGGARSAVDEMFDETWAKIVLADGIHDRNGNEIGPRPRPRTRMTITRNDPKTPRSSPSAPPRGYARDPYSNPATSGMPGYPRGRVTTGGSPYAERSSPPPFPEVDGKPATRPATPSSPEIPWDNSNSQYGLLGVWAGAECGIEVPLAYWKSVEAHWTRCQLADGQWYYSRAEQSGRLSMTLAGIASLFVTHDYIDAPALGGKRGPSRDPYGPAPAKGLFWLETDNNSVDVKREPLFYIGYNLFGLERVALASGMKFLGDHDWYAELAAEIVPTQQPNGAFGRGNGGKDDLIDTAYVLLFLVRGRYPVMMNKLAFNDFWTNRPRDIANLAHDVTNELERPINWQVVDLQQDPAYWADSPILYMASHHDVNFTDDEIGKLRTFIDDGGILFTHADLGAKEFNDYAAVVAKKLFPQYEFKDLSPEHSLYSVHKAIKAPRPKLRAVSNGSRLLMVHSPTDLSNAWQTRSKISRKEAFDIGGNLYVYATGKEQFRNRLDTPAIPAPPPTASQTINVARLKYDGNWNPEPSAWRRFSRIFQWETGTKLDLITTEIKYLAADKCIVAHLTGIEAFAPSAEQTQAMRAFVEAGGTLLIDTVGGGAAFNDSTTTWLAAAFPNISLESVDVNDPMLRRGKDDLIDPTHLKLRLYALEKLGTGGTRLKTLKAGKGLIIYSTLDITSGLLGTSTWGILGYSPEYSQALIKNILVQRMQ